MIAKVRGHFDAAHYLPNYKGKCSNVHGHRWEVEIKVTGEKKSNGMIIDFVELKKALNEVLDELDHQLLNDILENPTAENLAEYIFEKLQTKINEGRLISVEVFESPDASVTYA